VMQRLMSLANIVGAETRRHRFYTLALPGQQQTGAIGFHGNSSIQVLRGLRQAIEIGREAFLLGAWRDRLGAHELQPATIKVVTAMDSSGRASTS